MKRIIVIYGNLACGKSTVINHLMPLLPDEFRKVSADDERWRIFRKSPRISGIKRESMVRDRLNRAYEKYDDIVFETSLAGKYDRHLLKKHTRSSNRIWYCYLKISRTTARDRYFDRKKTGYLMPPWPYRNQDELSSIEYMHQQHRKTPKDHVFDAEKEDPVDIATEIAALCLTPFE